MNRLLNQILPVKRIKSLQFRILSPEEIENMSYLLVTNTEGINNGITKSESAYDLKLGTIGRERCKTCGANSETECGHYGHIRLSKPVFNVCFMPTILKIFRCLCFKCGKLLIDDEKFPEILSLPKSKRIKKCSTLVKDKECPECKSTNPKFDVKDVYNLSWNDGDGSGKKEVYIPPEFVLERFKLLTDDEIELFGFSPKFSRPEWFIVRNVLLIPPTNRPIVQNARGDKSEDNMFKLYQLIIKYNTILAQEIAKHSGPITIDDYQKTALGFRPNFEALSFSVASMMTDKVTKTTKLVTKSGKVESVKETIKGKKGWIKNNCMGKRVDYSGRTVIAPAEDQDVDVFSIPRYFAKTLCFPDRVNQYNIEFLRERIIIGEEGYPGAQSIILNENGKSSKKTLVKMPEAARKALAEKLSFGSIVNRHLVDGDVVIFNRQPSLHKYSFMGVKIKVLPEGQNVIKVTFGSNKQFNADFDGDECQNHGPRSLTTANEMRRIMSIREHFVSFTNSDVQVGPLQDSVLGPYLLSENGSLLISKESFMNYILSAGYFNIESIDPKRKVYRLIEAYESLIPENFNMKGYGLNIEFGKFVGSKFTTETTEQVTPDPFIEERILIPEKAFREDNIKNLLVSDEKIIKEVHKFPIMTGKNIKEGFIRTLFYDYSPNICNNFVVGSQKMINNFLRFHGETCSIRDVTIPAELRKKLKANIESAHREHQLLLDELDEGKIIPPITKTIKEYYEILIGQRTGKYLADNMRLVVDHMKKIKDSKKPNNLFNMISSGSKGSQVNIINIVDNIGQTSVNGKRIEKVLQNRSLTCYPKYDERLETGGFVSNSFSEGLDSASFFAHQKGSRNGLIDTAIKVKTTGYITTRLVKSNEDIIQGYDNRVIRHSGQIVAEIFGTNGCNPMFLIDNTEKLYEMNDELFFKTYISG